MISVWWFILRPFSARRELYHFQNLLANANHEYLELRLQKPPHHDEMRKIIEETKKVVEEDAWQRGYSKGRQDTMDNIAQSPSTIPSMIHKIQETRTASFRAGVNAARKKDGNSKS